MSNPSRATLQTAWANVLKLIDEARRYGGGSSSSLPSPNATNWVTLQNTLETALAGDFLDELENGVQQARANLASIISPGLSAAMQRPFLKQYCKSVIGRTNLSDDATMWQEMYKYFIDNSLRVQSRAFTFGTPAAGTNTGNGQILRLTKDRYNFDIENGYVDSKRAICILDENTGTGRGQEVFELKGQATARDELERSGSGLTGTLTGLTPDDSLLNNPAFRIFGGTAGTDAPTSLDGWTSTDITGASLAYSFSNYGILQTSGSTYRNIPSDGSTGTAGNLQMKVSSRITQKLTVRGTELNNDTPYLLVVVWNAALGSANGTLNLRMGSLTTTVTLTGQANWNVSTVPNPLGQGCWYRNFAQADLQIQIEFIRTSGTLNVAEVMLVPGTQFDGSWYWALPATASAYTQWRVLDSYTWPDIATGNAVLQSHFHRAFGIYLPHSNGSSITWAQI